MVWFSIGAGLVNVAALRERRHIKQRPKRSGTAKEQRRGRGVVIEGDGDQVHNTVSMDMVT